MSSYFIHWKTWQKPGGPAQIAQQSTLLPGCRAHPPFALGRDVHFSHSILQHVNICPRSKLCGAVLFTPTASCLRIHVSRLRLRLTSLRSALAAGHIPAGWSVAGISPLYLHLTWRTGPDSSPTSLQWISFIIPLLKKSPWVLLWNIKEKPKGKAAVK